MKYFSGKEIKDALERAQQAIKDEIASGEDTAVTIVEIGKKFNLHIDIIGIIAELNRNMLLGLIGPEEFLKELIASGVSDSDAQEIMKEINQKIFVPLREQMRSGAGNTQSIQSAEPIKPIPTRNEPSFTNSTPANPRFPRSVVFNEEKMRPSQTFASVPKYTPPSRPVEVRQQSNIGEPTRVALNNGLAYALKQVLHKEDETAVNPNEKLLEDHEEPHIEIDKTSVPPNLPGVIQPGARFSPRLAVTPSEGGPIAHEVKPSPIIPKTEPLAPSILSEPPKPIPPITPPVASVAPVTPTSHPAPSRPYSTDPYREPIDTP